MLANSLQDIQWVVSMPDTDLSEDGHVLPLPGAHLVMSSRTEGHRTSGAPVVGMFPLPPRAHMCCDVTARHCQCESNWWQVEGGWRGAGGENWRT